MPEKHKLELRCPICKEEVKSGGPDFPFCSDRCRTIDLGNWASGAYTIPSALPDEEERVPGSAPHREPDEDA
jgi:uncharacterized protein